MIEARLKNIRDYAETIRECLHNAEHSDDCDSRFVAGDDAEYSCSCGFDNAIMAVEALRDELKELEGEMIWIIR